VILGIRLLESNEGPFSRSQLDPLQLPVLPSVATMHSGQRYCELPGGHGSGRRCKPLAVSPQAVMPSSPTAWTREPRAGMTSGGGATLRPTRIPLCGLRVTCSAAARHVMGSHYRLFRVREPQPQAARCRIQSDTSPPALANDHCPKEQDVSQDESTEEAGLVR